MKSKTIYTLISLLSLLFLSVGCSNKSTNDSANNGSEKEIKWTFSHAAPKEHPYHQVAELFKERLSEYSDGQINLDIKDSGSIGGETETLEFYKSGDLEAGIHFSAAVSSLYEEFGYLDIPFLFDSHEHWVDTMTSDEALEHWNNVVDERDSGFSIGVIGAGTERSIYSNNLIEESIDLKGIKMRVNENPLAIEIWESIGSIPVQVTTEDVYTGLQSGLIEALDGSLNAYTGLKHSEVAKYLLMTRHSYGTAFIMISDKAYKDLSRDLQEAVDRALEDVRAEWYIVDGDDNDRVYEELKGKDDITITEPSEEVIEELQNISRPIVESSASEYGMETFVELIDKYR